MLATVGFVKKSTSYRHGVRVRDGNREDLERLNEIYNWTIVDNHVSFDTEPWDIQRRISWWEERDSALDFLVAVDGDDRVVGVTYSSWYRPKLAYRSTAETTIALDQNNLGEGLGTELLGALLIRLGERGFNRAVAIIALPNPGSIALHRKLGYREVGVMTDIGFKLGRFWDTLILECQIVPQQ